MKTNLNGGNGVVQRKSERFRYSGPALLAVAIGMTLSVNAGDLNPPLGPIAATNRVQLNQQTITWPYVISTSGSYVLTSNLVAPSGFTGNGIEITASGVTLDLMGFELVGVPSSFDGIRASAAVTEIAVVNGSVRNWGQFGLQLFNATNIRLADLRTSGNTGIGSGSGSSITNCSATGGGIGSGSGSMITNCSATGGGIGSGSGSMITNCSATGGGISAGSGSTISNSSASFNTGIGIFAGDGCTITNCSASDNSTHGIATGVACTIINCSARQNGFGIVADAGSTITDCSAYSNILDGVVAAGSTMTNCSAASNTGVGIRGGACTITNCSAWLNTGSGFGVNGSSTVTNCSGYGNGGDGISASSGDTITNCSAAFNAGDGISVNFNCTVRGNTCDANGAGTGDGAGIHAASSDNRIEGNNCTRNDRGIDVDAGGNFITRNTCSGNTTNNWDVVAGNVCLVISATTSAAIVGDSGGVAPGSTDPNANFTY